MWGALSDERICHLQLLLILASAVILGSKSRGTRDHILLFQIRDSPNLEGQVPVFISPRNRAAQSYPRALGSLYDSQGYGGGIRNRLTRSSGNVQEYVGRINRLTDRIENEASDNSSIVAWLFVCFLLLYYFFTIYIITEY
jgi:hypothetical protein